jgi:hypothetical protein
MTRGTRQICSAACASTVVEFAGARMRLQLLVQSPHICHLLGYGPCVSITGDLIVITTDPESGKSRLGTTQADAVVGGAILLDLIALGRIDLAGEGRKARAVVIDASPVPDWIAEAAFARVRDRRPMKPRDLVTKLGKGAKVAQYDALVASGVLQAREVKVAGLFPRRRHSLLRPTERAALLASVRSALLEGAEPDERTGPIVGLLSAADLLGVVVGKRDLRQAKTRAAAFGEGDWASQGVRDAIRAAQTAVAAATVAATSAAATSS